MNLTVTAEMHLDYAAEAWLQTYVREMFEQAALICREVHAIPNFHFPPGIPDNAWDALYVKLLVHLRASTWTVNGVAGQTGGYKANIDLGLDSDANDPFLPRGFNRPDLAANTDRIEMFWDSIAEERDRTLRHEFCHMIWRHALSSNWHAFGHGGCEGNMDPFQLWMKYKMHKIYRPHGVEYPVVWRYPMGG